MRGWSQKTLGREIEIRDGDRDGCGRCRGLADPNAVWGAPRTNVRGWFGVRSELSTQIESVQGFSASPP